MELGILITPASGQAPHPPRKEGAKKSSSGDRPRPRPGMVPNGAKVLRAMTGVVALCVHVGRRQWRHVAGQQRGAGRSKVHPHTPTGYCTRRRSQGG